MDLLEQLGALAANLLKVLDHCDEEADYLFDIVDLFTFLNPQYFVSSKLAERVLEVLKLLFHLVGVDHQIVGMEAAV